MRLPTRVRFMVTPFSSGSDLTTKHVARNKSGTVQDVPGDSNPMQETASGAASLDDFMFAIYGHGNQRQSPSCDLSFVSKRVGNSGEKLEVVVEVQHLESSSLDDLEWYIRSSKDFQWSCAFICKAKGFNQALDTIFIHCLSCQLPVLLWGKSIDTKQPRALRCNLSLETGFDLFCFASLHGRNRSFQSIYGNLQRVAHEQQPPGFCRPDCNSIAREAPGSRFGEQFGKLHNFPKRRIISLFTHFSPAYRAGNFKSLWSEASFNGGVAAGKECLGSAVKSHKTQKKQNTVTQWHSDICISHGASRLRICVSCFCTVPCHAEGDLPWCHHGLKHHHGHDGYFCCEGSRIWGLTWLDTVTLICFTDRHGISWPYLEILIENIKKCWSFLSVWVQTKVGGTAHLEPSYHLGLVDCSLLFEPVQRLWYTFIIAYHGAHSWIVNSHDWIWLVYANMF